MPKARIVEAAQPKLLSQDTAAIDNYVTDPLNNTNKIQVRPGYLMGKATFWLADRISEFTHPFLILHGTNDVCTSFPHAKNFYENAASDDKTFQPVDGAYHLLSHGPERKRRCKAAGWIAARSEERSLRGKAAGRPRHRLSEARGTIASALWHVAEKCRLRHRHGGARHWRMCSERLTPEKASEAALNDS